VARFRFPRPVCHRHDFAQGSCEGPASHNIFDSSQKTAVNDPR